MKKTALFYGQSSYALASETTRTYTTVLAGNTVAQFNLGGKWVSPFFIVPWWNEGWSDEVDPLINMFLGVFFCLPQGGDPTGCTGKSIAIHGNCCNDTWDYEDGAQEGGSHRLHLRFSDEVGVIDKNLCFQDGQTWVYEDNVVSKCQGKYPVGYHPTLRLPEVPGSAHFAMSAFSEAFSTFESHEFPEKRGYSLLPNGLRITDLTKIRTAYGDEIDFTQQPIRQGFEDVFMSFNKGGDFAYIAITYKEEGYVYFELKNPDILKNTMFWVSNGGRNYAPWNGRCRPVLGLEETTSFFHYGVERSVNPNPVTEAGHPTCAEFEADKRYHFPLIYGVAAVPKGFAGVAEIVPEADGMTIVGVDGTRIPVGVDLSFLKKA